METVGNSEMAKTAAQEENQYSYDWSNAKDLLERSLNDFPGEMKMIKSTLALISRLEKQQAAIEAVEMSLGRLRILMQIKKMATKNEWFENETMKVYVRRTNRLIGEVLGDNLVGKVLGRSDRMDTLEIGAIEVAEKYRNQGVFKSFLSQFENLASLEGRVVYIENVMEGWLRKRLMTYGYKEDGRIPDCSCFYKKTSF